MDGGVGDHMASLTAVNYITKQYPYVKPLVWVPDFLLELSQHLLPSRALVRNFSSMKSYYNYNLPTKTTKWDQIISPMKSSCLDYAFMKLADEIPSIEHRNYLSIRPKAIDVSKFNLPNRYMVLTTAFTAGVREWPAAEVNKVISHIKDLGITPVFIGASETKTGTKHIIKGSISPAIEFKLGIDLIDKTSLLEAARIMGDAICVMGVDNGLLHVAGLTDTWIIGGFTTVDPKHRMPIRSNTLGYKYVTVVPPKALGCRFCQCKTNFLYGSDYRNCLYKDNACTTHMSADKFILAIDNIL